MVALEMVSNLIPIKSSPVKPNKSVHWLRKYLVKIQLVFDVEKYR